MHFDVLSETTYNHHEHHAMMVADFRRRFFVLFRGDVWALLRTTCNRIQAGGSPGTGAKYLS